MLTERKSLTMRCNITREEIESIYKEGEENQRLKEILSKDSHNSHKPPSSDVFKKRR